MKFIDHLFKEQSDGFDSIKHTARPKRISVNNPKDDEFDTAPVQTYEEILDTVDYDSDDLTYDTKNGGKYKNKLYNNLD